ncbi:amidase [Pontixanthobacter aquaemixtae]|uniref:Amidase n=1 Tax=Pontixanthobacter aquaemixtae TaxID=1958940 RepID=A0A844ZNK4_9SPHN|nr:amidase [Pontixanthobacter aquaemixtae]MXO89425.1 amidase [Pontixanthobacter aquaemixtae]
MTIRQLTATAFLLATALGAPSASADSIRNTPEEARHYLERIEALDDAGPELNAVIVYNPEAPEIAAEMRGTTRLGGRTVLVKDNIETSEFPTTAGSLALKDNNTGRDAPLIENIRAAGGVILGKTNLSEWANIRDRNSTSGWSAIGELTKNPHATDRNACGSSSGSGAAIAAGFAWAAIGTETNGSITCPASINGVVGFKPSVGLVSRTHIVPISSTQDTAGPMTRTVYDAALLLTAMAGEDAADKATLGVSRQEDYTQGLMPVQAANYLQGIRIGVMRNQIGNREDVAAVFETALADMQRAGAILVDIEIEPDPEMYRDSFTVLMFELREGMGKYLQSLPAKEGDANVPHSLADLIAFNKQNAAGEMRWFGQSLFEQAEQTTDREVYETARENAVRIAGAETLDKLLADNDVRFLIAPTRGPAWVSDLVNGDSFNGSIGFGSPAAIAGYPHLTVPMGAVESLPVGISFFGAKWNDHEVLKAGAAYETARSAKLPTPSFERWDLVRGD